VTETTNRVALRGLGKSFGDFHAVRDVDLEIPSGSYYCLLGPSGSGKSTILRMIAGLEGASTGTITIGDVDVTAMPPTRRPVHTVFQSYALFPRLSVFDNVAYGLRAQGVRNRSEITRRVEEALDQVRLTGRSRQKPASLSGGMQQRVALARALVNRPRVLLLDEPLGALDLQLRREMQEELVRLHGEGGTTFIHVTHDQEECFACATDVAVMSTGRIEQAGSPREVYRRPSSVFVAGFLGTASQLAARVASVGPAGYEVRWAGGVVAADGPPGLGVDEPVTLVVRPEDVDLAAPAESREEDGWLAGTLLHVAEAASMLQARVRVGGPGDEGTSGLGGGAEVIAERTASPGASLDVEPGGEIAIRIDRERGWIVPEGEVGAP
jgi:spermidine/putrescine transport system ATP-binding protein